MINIIWENDRFLVNNSHYNSGETFQLSEPEPMNFSTSSVQSFIATVLYKNSKIIRFTTQSFIISDSEIIEYIYVNDGASFGILYIDFDFPFKPAKVYSKLSGFEIIKNNVFKFTVPDSCPNILHYFSENCPHMGSDLHITPSTHHQLNTGNNTLKVLDTNDGFTQISSYIYKLEVNQHTPDILYYFSASTSNSGGFVNVENS